MGCLSLAIKFCHLDNGAPPGIVISMRGAGLPIRSSAMDVVDMESLLLDACGWRLQMRTVWSVLSSAGIGSSMYPLESSDRKCIQEAIVCCYTDEAPPSGGKASPGAATRTMHTMLNDPDGIRVVALACLDAGMTSSRGCAWTNDELKRAAELMGLIHRA